MKLILQLRHGFSSGDELFHYVHSLFISSLKTDAVMNHESLVRRRAKLPINVSLTTSVLGGVLEANSELRTHRITWVNHSRHSRRQTLSQSMWIYQRLTRTK